MKEILFFCQKNKMGLNIELKPNLGFEKKNVEAIANLLKIINFQNQFYFSSFDWNSVILMKQYMPDAHFGLLVDKFNSEISFKDALDICHKYHFYCCGFNKKIINSEIMDCMDAENLITTIYSEKNVKIYEANELWSMGVKSIFIDDPSNFNIF